MSGAQDNGARKWIFTAGAAALFVLSLGGLRPLRANVTGTAGFETGLQTLATVKMKRADGAIVYWGDLNWIGDPNSNEGLLNCHYASLHKCDILGTHVYANPGTYHISIKYAASSCLSNCGQTATATATISSPGNFVILTIGDSIASGQGTPDVNYDSADYVKPNAYWDDPPTDYHTNGPCARSSKSGFVQAQNQVQTNNPAITTINYSCSGDTVDQTIAALQDARQHLPRIDVLLISVGADDIDGGFGNFLTQCLPANVKDFLHGKPCSQDTAFVDQTSDDIQALRSCQLPNPENPNDNPNDPTTADVSTTSCYPNLAKEINCIDPKTGLQDSNCTNPDLQIPKVVLITEYTDITHDQTGNYPTFKADPTCTLAEAALGSDWDFFYNGYLIPLNKQVDSFPTIAAKAGLAVPTHAVTGIQDDFFLHGYCAGHPWGTRWVNDLADSKSIIGPGPDPKNNKTYKYAATGHPNGAGAADYKSRIYNAIIQYNPPVTTPIGTTADGATYTFGTWTTQDVDINFSSTNAIKEAGVGPTYYTVDNPNCFPVPGGAGAGSCTQYTGPIKISSSGGHTITFFGTNASGNPEEPHSAEVLIDKGPPLGMAPATKTVAHGQSAMFAVTIGHIGWDSQTVNLSCQTDDPQATCTMIPRTVTLDPTNLNAADVVVSTVAGGASISPGTPTRFVPIHLLEALRALLALATALFLAATGLALRRRRWARVSSFAALAVLFGVLCAGCGQTTSGTSSNKTYTVTVTGVSGNTTNTASSSLIVK